jgi:hypothetical protein
MIEDRLQALTAPPATAAMERTAALAGRAVGPGERREGSGRMKLLIAAGLAVVTVLFVAATPPGRAVADAVGELVGIGDEPSQPLSLGDAAHADSVFGLGASPNGTRFEMATSSFRDGGSCVYISYPDVAAGDQRSAECITKAAYRALESRPVSPYPSVGPEDLGRESDLVLSIVAARDVASLAVTYIGTDGLRHTAPLPTGAGFETSVDFSSHGPSDETAELRYFIAFLPSTILGGRLTREERAHQRIHGSPFPDDDLVLDYDTVRTALRGIEITADDAEGERIGTYHLPDAWTVPLALAESPGGRFGK